MKTTKLLNVLVLVFTLIIFSSCNKNVLSTKYYPEYRIKTSPNAVLGAYGRKDNNGFQRHDILDSGIFKTMDASSQEFKRSEYNKIILKAKKGKFDGEMNYDNSNNETYKLFEVQIEKNASVIEHLNRQVLLPESRFYQVMDVNDLRFVTGIIVAFDNMKSDSLSIASKISIKKDIDSEANILLAQFEGGGTKEIKFGDGNVIGYRFSHLCWQGEKIKWMESDYPGRGENASKKCEKIGDYTEKRTQ